MPNICSSLDSISVAILPSQKSFTDRGILDYTDGNDLSRNPDLSIKFRGFNKYGIAFRGIINNLDVVKMQLNNNLTNVAEIINAAVDRWGVNVNQYLTGDFVILFRHKNRLIATSSSQSTYSLYYRRTKELKISFDINDVIDEDGIVLNENLVYKEHLLGPILQRETFLANVSILLPGETIVWRLIDGFETILNKRLNEKAFNLASVNAPNIKPISSKHKYGSLQLFKNIPQLATYLKEPVFDSSLVEFDLMLAQESSEIICIDESWLYKRNYQYFDLDSALKFWGKLISHRLKKQKSEITAFYASIRLEYQKQFNAEQTDFSFEQWFDYQYVLPRWLRALQRIANKHHKHLWVNEDALRKVMQTSAQVSNMRGAGFKISDESSFNVFDATQRLMYSGAKLTRKLFRVIPPLTAGLIKKTADYPSKVEQICMQLITLDYLLRFYSYQND